MKTTDPDYEIWFQNKVKECVEHRRNLCKEGINYLLNKEVQNWLKNLTNEWSNDNNFLDKLNEEADKIFTRCKEQ